MKVGDLVKWVGFPGADKKGVKATGPSCLGIILKVYEQGIYKYRVDVQWSNGSLGDCLYRETIEIVSKYK